MFLCPVVNFNEYTSDHVVEVAPVKIISKPSTQLSNDTVYITSKQQSIPHGEQFPNVLYDWTCPVATRES